MKKIITLTTLMCFLSVLTLSQKVVTTAYSKSYIDAPVVFKNKLKTNTEHEHERCIKNKKEDELIKNNPAYANALASAKTMTRQIANNPSSGARAPIYTIPVVFHVIHKGEPVGTGTNISDAQLQSAIDGINRDFRETNADGGIAIGAGPDTEIDFCLASVDPSGNPHSGINRVNGTSVTNYAAQGIISSNELAVKSLSRWDNRYYLNVWVVSEIDNNGADVANVNAFGGGTIGYAYLPVNPVTFNSDRDGIVILNLATGNDPNQTQGYRLWGAGLTNRTLTHEVGHYLGLNHTFNNTASCSSETNCNTQGDEICDTPPTTGGLSANPTTCADGACPGAQTSNYMDYTQEVCQNQFTNGQTTIMRAVLAGVRNAVVNTSNCSAATITADFVANATSVNSGATIAFTDLSSGSTATSWNWTFGGGGTPNTSTVQNPSVVFNTPGTYTVSLTVSDGSLSDTETKTSYITVTAFSPTTCDSVNNFLAGDTLAFFNLPTWGAYPGHNGYGFKTYAEPYNASSPTEVQRVGFVVFELSQFVPTSALDIVIYDDNAGEPGTVLGAQSVLFSDLVASSFNVIPLTNAVPVSGDYWVALDLDYSTGDTIVFGTSRNRVSYSTYETTYIKTTAAASAWTSSYAAFSNGLATSMYMDVYTAVSPSVNFTESATTINTGNSVTFNGSSSTNYTGLQWEFDGGSIATSTNLTETVTYNTPGTYDATLFMIGGCSRVDSLKKQIVVSNTTDIKDAFYNNNISVYPNPVKEQLFVDFNENVKGEFLIQIISSNGQLVYAKSIQSGGGTKTSFDMNRLAKGVYEMRISNNDHAINKRVIVQ